MLIDESLQRRIPDRQHIEQAQRAQRGQQVDDVPLDPGAAWAAIPPRTMTRRFSLETGFSFTQWRQRLRRHGHRARPGLRQRQCIYRDVPAHIGVTPTRYFTQAGGGDGRFVQDTRPVLGG
ncbi:MAG TPA: hypothetical protein VJR58_31630 [Vineibacter sp.]|nr:hypothetical protein [Vineibacter sp.]